MSFDWSEYIILAEKLIENSSGEAEMRSATSRAYYGAFIQCRNFKRYNVKTTDIHQKVIGEFKGSDSSIENIIGNFLDSLRIKRNDSDYDGFKTPTLLETKQNISTARRIIDKLEEIKNENNLI